MGNVSEGRVVRLAATAANDGSEKGVVVRCVGAPMPNLLRLPESERAHALNVWQGLPAQVTVFWQETGRVEFLLSSEVVLDNPHCSYRAEDHGFPMFAVDTDGYDDLGVRSPDGEEVVRIGWSHVNSDPGDPDTFRQRLHRLMDAYCDAVVSRHPSQTVKVRG